VLREPRARGRDDVNEQQINALAERVAMLVVKHERRHRLALSKAAAAHELGISLAHFERHVLDQLSVVYAGSRVLIPRRELERWLERRAEPILRRTG
jgi:hypothetical protein